jgi:CRP-like cAMP-binding protein
MSQPNANPQDLLREVWLFSGCSDAELGYIASLVTPRSVEADTAIVREGEPGDDFFVIVSGSATPTVDGDPVGELTPGSFFGEMALLDGAERLATVTSTTPMELLVLNREDFNTMLEAAMPTVAPKLLTVVGRRMRDLARHEGRPTLGY